MSVTQPPAQLWKSKISPGSGKCPLGEQNCIWLREYLQTSGSTASWPQISIRRWGESRVSIRCHRLLFHTPSSLSFHVCCSLLQKQSQYLGKSAARQPQPQQMLKELSEWVDGLMNGWKEGWMDEKKNVDVYPQCYSGKSSDIGGMYLRKKRDFTVLLKNFCIWILSFLLV